MDVPKIMPSANSDVKLFAVFLGGRAPKCNTELHDVVFVVGTSLEDTYEQLLHKWFGTPIGLHVDSWFEVTIIDGYKITLNPSPRESTATAEMKGLYFINLGAYKNGEFGEVHANTFLVAENDKEMVRRAKSYLLTGMKAVHTDDIYDLDDFIRISTVNGYGVELSPTEETVPFEPNNGYKILPKSVIADYVRRHPDRVNPA